MLVSHGTKVKNQKWGWRGREICEGIDRFLVPSRDVETNVGVARTGHVDWNTAGQFDDGCLVVTNVL